MASEEDKSKVLGDIGVPDKALDEITRNKKVLNAFYDIIKESDIESVDEKLVPLLHSLAVSNKGEEIKGRKWISEDILSSKLNTKLQVTEAYKYLKDEGENATLEGMEKASGVGVNLSDGEVESLINKYLDSRKDEIESKRYSVVPALLGDAKRLPELKWAKQSLFKPCIDKKILDMIGPKDERDIVKKEKKKKKALQKGDDDKGSGKADSRSMFTEGFLGELHKPGENPQKYPELMEEHLKFTKGKVFTRFPPEPNGYLHIGHSKAIMVNFGYAKFHGGNCYLRFDDTNPEAEEEQYFTSIEKMVEWLGFEPWKITYSSDYFDKLYDLAEELIKIGRGYVCHCTPEEVKAQRGLKEDGTLGGERFACVHRNRSVEANLEEFRKMKNGFYKSGEATLRMKQDLNSSNPQMWDLVAYRVLNKPHHRTGDKWKIYPTYDFTHCLVDSFENISHSLCTTEFRLSRESYEWLCDVLHVYRPAQREYGRLNITGTVLSKRKIAKLVSEGFVRDWDDPRLYTLEAIRRRGVPPGAILSFINTLGVTTSTTNIQEIRFESAVRGYLDQTTPRLMMVLDPLEIEIENLSDDFEELVEIPYKPGDLPRFGSRKVPFTKHIFIDSSDYRLEILEDYFRLAPGQPVGLIKVPFNILVKDTVKDANGKVIKIIAHYDNEGKHQKPKTYIQWVPKALSLRVDEVRIQNQLFKSENPSAHPDGFLKDINPDSEQIVHGAVIEPAFEEIVSNSPMNIEIENSAFNIKEKKGNETIRFQALRIGYFCLDKDSTDKSLVLNRIVTLKEDAAKK